MKLRNIFSIKTKLVGAQKNHIIDIETVLLSTHIIIIFLKKYEPAYVRSEGSDKHMSGVNKK